MNSRLLRVESRKGTDPKVTIILPVRNNARFIGDALKSAAAQSYERVDIVVVDGASTDGTQQTALTFPTVRLISEPDRSQAEATNKGIERTDSDIILILCGDDVLHTDGVKKAVQAFTSGGDVDIVFGKVGKIDAEGREISPGHAFGDFSLRRAILQNARFPCPTYPSATAFIRRSFLARAGFRFDECLRTCPDYDMWLQLGLHARVVYVPYVLAYWREHAGSGSIRPNFRDVIIESKIKALEKLFSNQALPRELRRLEPRAYAILRIVDSSCYQVSNGSIAKGLVEALHEVKKCPTVLVHPHVYGLILRSVAIGMFRLLRLHGVVRGARMWLARLLGRRIGRAIDFGSLEHRSRNPGGKV